jgi:hypothetical protein
MAQTQTHRGSLTLLCLKYGHLKQLPNIISNFMTGFIVFRLFIIAFSLLYKRVRTCVKENFLE